MPDFPTLEARFELFGFLVSEVRTVQQLADTPWADERGVFVEVEPGARVAGAPFRSDRATIGVRGPGAAVRRSTPARCSPNAAGSPTTSSTQLEADGVIHSSGDVDTARPDWK